MTSKILKATPRLVNFIQKSIRLRRVWSFLILFFTFCCGHGYGQSRNAKSEALQLKKVLSEYHVSPPAIDNRFSHLVFNQFLNTLDPDRIFFTVNEINELKKLEPQIDDDLNTSSWNFLPLMLTLYKKALERAQNIVNLSTDKPFDFFSERGIQYRYTLGN